MLKRPDTIDCMWRSFTTRANIEDAPAHQLYEMELAFKCGAAAILVEMNTTVADLSEQAGVNTLERWMGEIDWFLRKRVNEHNQKQGVKV